MRNYDVIVVGGGPAGYHAAALASQAGLSTLLVEKSHMGGTCLNQGCIPTKCFCASASTALEVARAQAMGISIPGAEGVQACMPTIVERKDAVVEQLRMGVESIVASAEIARGTAMFIAPKVILVNIRATEQTETASFLATAPKIVVATGSEASSLPIPGAHLCVDSTAMLSLNTLPGSLAVIGGGVIGMEFASVFNAFGCDVTVLEYCREILPPFDREIAKRLRTTLQRRGVKFVLQAQVCSVTETEGIKRRVGYIAKGKESEVEAEMVLMAVGRRPILPSGMAELGYATTPKGALSVDERMETSIEGVFAVGDCNGVCMLAHAAEAQARLVMGCPLNLSVVPSVVFTTPECAMAGLTEEQCTAQEKDIRPGKAFFRANGKACAMNETDGMVKVLVDNDTDTLLGCHICGPHAGDIIAEATLAINSHITIEEILATIHSHPSLSEAFADALRTAQ